MGGASEPNPMLALLMASASGRLYQKVARELALLIFNGEYPVGSRLPAERKLAEQLQVSRPTIREAIIALELAGCVEVKGGSGVYVIQGKSAEAAKKLSSPGPITLLEARLVLESEIAAMATQTISEQELAELSCELDGVSASDHDEVIFHKLIAKATRNDVLVSIGEHLWPNVDSHDQPISESESQCRAQERRAILEALIARDSTAAREAMRSHLSNCAERLLHSAEAQAVEAAKARVERQRERIAAVL